MTSGEANTNEPPPLALEYAPHLEHDRSLHRLLRLLVAWTAILTGAFALLAGVGQVVGFGGGFSAAISIAGVPSPELLLFVGRLVAEVLALVGGIALLFRRPAGAWMICISAFAKAIIFLAGPVVSHLTIPAMAAIYSTPARMMYLVSQTFSSVVPWLLLSALTLPRFARRMLN